MLQWKTSNYQLTVLYKHIPVKCRTCSATDLCQKNIQASVTGVNVNNAHQYYVLCTIYKTTKCYQLQFVLKKPNFLGF